MGKQTLGALTRNRAFRVLGRSTTELVAAQRISPRQMLAKFGVTHLLEGTVLRSGENVQISVSLTRTSDGIAVWQDTYRGRMREPFALQDAIANGIEGQVASTARAWRRTSCRSDNNNAEVYALYSEARQLISSRERANFQRAEALLRRAVAADPNLRAWPGRFWAERYFSTAGSQSSTRMHVRKASPRFVARSRWLRTSRPPTRHWR